MRLPPFFITGQGDFQTADNDPVFLQWKCQTLIIEKYNPCPPQPPVIIFICPAAFCFRKLRPAFVIAVAVYDRSGFHQPLRKSGGYAVLIRMCPDNQIPGHQNQIRLSHAHLRKQPFIVLSIRKRMQIRNHRQLYLRLYFVTFCHIFRHPEFFQFLVLPDSVQGAGCRQYMNHWIHSASFHIPVNEMTRWLHDHTINQVYFSICVTKLLKRISGIPLWSVFYPLFSHSYCSLAACFAIRPWSRHRQGRMNIQLCLP